MVKVLKIEDYEKNNKGIHTLSSIGNSTLIDGKRFGFRKDLFKIKLLDHKKSTKRLVKSLIRTSLSKK